MKFILEFLQHLLSMKKEDEMITLRLKRIYHKNYTEGDLIIPDYIKEIAGNTLKTLELTFKDNQRNISCIPEGNYEFHIHNSPKFGECIAISNVNNRDNILIHSGNTVSQFNHLDKFSNKIIKRNCDSQGCILIGKKLENITDTDNQEQGLLFESKKGLKILLNFLKSKNIDKGSIQIYS